MLKAGFVIHNPLTNARVTILEGEVETKGQGWLLEHRIPAAAQPDIPEHFHLTWTETFEIIKGQARYQLNGVVKTASAGEKIVFPPHQPHIHPWNETSEELIYRQRDEFGTPNPQAVQDVLGVFATTAALAREGKCDAQGRPRNPLQLVVTGKLLAQYGGYDNQFPMWFQNFMSATLGRLAEGLGYRAIYPQYLKSAE